ARALERFPDGTWLVELTPITDPALVASAVATAAGVREQPGRRSLDVFVDHLASQTALVVFDNCEHLVDATAEVAERILLACPGVVVLATSREQLGVPGETAWRVPSLSFPATHDARTDMLTQYESVQLFVERARKVRPNFTLDDTTAAPVAAICHRLDGIPLAVELAAARTRVLSPQQILDGLDDRFRLLTGGARTAVARQQTLRASVDWSYELLTEAERTLFARLSVFAGGFSLDAAEVVAGAEPVGTFAVLDLLQSLADRSLLVVTDSPRSDGGVRYRMLETIRQYAGERLAASDKADAVRTQHSEFYVTLAERAAPHLERAEQETWADRLDVENENVRVAFWHAHDRGDAERAQRLVAALFWYWIIRGHLRIGARVCRFALELPGPVRPEVRAAALVAACHVGWFRTDASVIPLAQEAVDVAREAGDRRLEGRALYHTGVWGGPAAAARAEDLEASIAIAREVGDSWSLAIGLVAAGTALNDTRRITAAAALFEEALAVCDALGERYIANTARYKLARAQLVAGRTADSEAMLRETIAH
ncbi:MAG: ATP-binding protein, partial [Acidimicrobiia bacterium]